MSEVDKMTDAWIVGRVCCIHVVYIIFVRNNGIVRNFVSEGVTTLSIT